VERIETLQNDKAWKTYVKQRESALWTEHYRFHGTPPHNVKGICKHGLKVYRGGVWTAAHSLVFAHKNSDFPLPVMYMFLVKVLLLSSSNPKAYMSEQASCVYPEFLITFKYESTAK